MQIQNSTKSLSSVCLRSDSTQFNQGRDAFHDIFQYMLNDKSGSRPPRIELTGILAACGRIIQGYRCKFKLETDSKDYFLSMSDALASVAKQIEGEEVIVRGFLDPDDGLFEVEKISLAHRSEAFGLSAGPWDPFFTLERPKPTAGRGGKLERAPEYLVS